MLFLLVGAGASLFYGEKERSFCLGRSALRHAPPAPSPRARCRPSMVPAWAKRQFSPLWSPGPSGMAPQSTALRSRTAAPWAPPQVLCSDGEPRPRRRPAQGIPAGSGPRRSRIRIGLDTGSQPIAGPPSPEHPHSPGGVPQLHPTAKAWNRPEHPRHGPARPMRAAKYLASVPHSEAPQPAPPKPCHPAIQALRPDPQSHTAPTCSNSSNLNSHPTSIYYAFNL